MVASLDSGESYLRLASEVRCELRPLGLGENDDSSAPSRQLYEFFVSADSKTCPHPTIRNRPDGHVTGDLFEEVKPGCYVFRKWRSCGRRTALPTPMCRRQKRRLDPDWRQPGLL